MLPFSLSLRPGEPVVDQTVYAVTRAIVSGQLQAGDRFPWLHLKFSANGPVEDSIEKLDDTKFNLLVFGQAAPAGDFGLGDLLSIHAIPADSMNDKELAQAGIPSQSFYLLRPDGYVGLCGGRLNVEALLGYGSSRLKVIAS